MKKYSPFHALLRAAGFRLSDERPYGDYKKVPQTAGRARLFNMYAIIKTGGKQYRVCVGDKLKVESLEAEVGSQITLTEVLAVAGEDGLKVGAPVLEGASVTATVLSHGRGEKVRIFKFRRRNFFFNDTATTEIYTELKIEAIAA